MLISLPKKNKGQTALDIAISKKHTTIIELLEKATKLAAEKKETQAIEELSLIALEKLEKTPVQIAATDLGLFVYQKAQLVIESKSEEKSKKLTENRQRKRCTII